MAHYCVIAAGWNSEDLRAWRAAWDLTTAYRVANDGAFPPIVIGSKGKVR